MKQAQNKASPNLKDKPNDPVEKLLWVMACLRNPDGGCPWDIEQTFKTIVPYTIEEAYEVADAIDRGDMADLQEELGDLLLQVVYHAQMAAENGDFAFMDVAGGIAEKMIARHPHVFGDKAAATAQDVNVLWEDQKEAEKGAQESAMDGVTMGLPALLRAEKLQRRAARVGYEWPDAGGAFAKLEEEIAEFKEACAGGKADEIEDEFGDVLFCLCNYGRMNGISPEEALRKASAKFEKRFRGMEDDLKAEGIEFSEAPLETLLAFWNRQKTK